MPLMSRSDASTFCTRSLNTTVIFVRLVTIVNAGGNCVEMVGAMVFVGGIVITTVMGAEVAVRPLAPETIADKMFVPNGASQPTLNGAATSLLKAWPLARNCTF